MVKIRKVSKAGVTVKYVGGRFMVTRDGATEFVELDEHPNSDGAIMVALEGLLTHY